MFRRVTLAALLVTAGAVLAATPASAGNGVPDLKIAKAKAGPYKGNNVYSKEGKGQTIAKRAKPGAVRRFYIKLENDGTGAEELQFDCPFDTATYVELRFFRGDTEITDDLLETGTYELELDTDKTVLIRVRAKVKASTPPGVYAERAVLGDDTFADADQLRFKLKVS